MERGGEGMRILKQGLLVVGLKILEIMAVVGGMCIFICLALIIGHFVEWLSAFRIINIMGWTLLVVLGMAVGGAILTSWFCHNWKWAGELIDKGFKAGGGEL